MDDDVAVLVEQGRRALAAGEWETARSRLARASERSETGEVLDRLSEALYWLGDYPQALALRERAFALHRRRGEHRPAAAVAIRLAALHGMIYGNGTAVSGWLGLAADQLTDAGDCPELGWLELFHAVITDDPAERARRATRALDRGRRFADVGLEFDALGYLGKATVERGDVADGMAMIDRAVAAIAGGLVADPWVMGEIYCTLFHACEMAVDVARADDWLDAVDGYVERTGELPVSGICRMHYGGLLTAAGRWEQAERELLTAAAIYADRYPGTRFEPLVRLADLRVRQGRLEEAERLLEDHDQRPGAAIVCARLHLARGELQAALHRLDRHLDRRGRGLLEVPALALLVEVALADGRNEDAATAADELDTLAAATTHAAVHGFAALSRGRLAAAEGHAGSTRHYEDALAAFTAAGLRHELAVARLELAGRRGDDQPELAREQARAALSGFQRVGATRDADAAAALLRRLGERAGRSWSRHAGPLTPRQAEVLALLADGLSNAQIAERLYISPRTAEHHVSNILAQLDLRSRAEATAYAVRHAVGGDPASP